MALPGEPLKLSAAELEALTKRIDEELQEGLWAHEDVENRIEEYQKLYLGEPEEKVKTFPWQGAANLVIPLIGTTVDSVQARIVNTMFSVEPFWTIRALHKDFVPVAKPAEDFMQFSSQTEFDLYSESKDFSREVVQVGWSWFKATWDVHTERHYDGARMVEEVVHRPNPTHVMVADMIGQAGAIDPLRSDWIAHRFRLTDGELAVRAADRIYRDLNLEDMFSQKEDIPNAITRGSGEIFEGTTKANTFYEIWWNAPIPGRKDKYPVNAVLTYHRPSRKFVRMIHNPLYYAPHPFVRGRFVDILGSSEGLGIARQLKYMQREISTIHRQQLDNATLANTRFFLGRRGVVKSGTRIWPGRFLTVPDPERDVKVVQLGDVYNSMAALEGSVLAFAERRSGVSDYALGRESSVIGDRATATGTLAILQEGNRRFDLNVRDMRAALGRVGELVLQLNQQYRPRGVAIFVQGEEGQLTELVFDLPKEFVKGKLGVEVTASTATINKQVEQQGLISLLGILIQNMQIGQQAAAVAANPEAPAEMREYTLKAFMGLSQLVQRVARTFDQKDADMLVPGLIAQQGQQGVGNGVSGPAPNGGVPGAAGGGPAV